MKTSRNCITFARPRGIHSGLIVLASIRPGGELAEESAFDVRQFPLWTKRKSQLALIFPKPDKWDPTHLFADVGKWQEDFAWLQRTYPKLHGLEGQSRGIGADAGRSA